MFKWSTLRVDAAGYGGLGGRKKAVEFEKDDCVLAADVTSGAIIVSISAAPI